MKPLPLIAVLLLALAAGYGGAKLANPAPATAIAAKETAYERVLRTGVLRCGYTTWPPFAAKNLETGKFEGLYVELAEAYMAAFDIKVEWAYELGAGQQIEAFKTGRIDTICLDGPWTASLAKYIGFAKPALFAPVYIYQDAAKPALDMNALNNKDVIFSMLDGDISMDLANKIFPDASRLALPAIADPALLLENVKAGKANVTINDEMSVGKFEKSSGASFKKVSQRPLAVYGLSFSAQPGEGDLLNLLNQAVDITRRNGIEDKIIDRYSAEYPGALLRSAQEYR